MIRRSALLFYALVLGACPPPKPVEDGGVDAGLTVTPVELCERLAASRCELKLRCYPAFTRPSRESCVTQENSACLAEYETLRPSFEDAKVEIDPAKLASCEQRMKTSACPPSFPPDYPIAVARPFSDCGLQSGLLIGKVPSGQTCERAVECQPGVVCIKPGGVCRGTCSSWPRETEPCAFGCAPGLRCNANTDTCVALALQDDACTSSAECHPDLICLGTCRPRRKLGEVCAFDADRLSPCEPGLACDVVPFVDGATGTCVRPKAANEPCRFHWSCQPGLICADIDWTNFPNGAPTEGSCRQPDGLDFNCSRSQYLRYVGDQCQAGTTCRQDTGKCDTLPTLGQSCTPSLQNCEGFDVHCKPSGSGDVGVCTGPAGLSDTCAFQIDVNRTVGIPCSTGYCDTESTLTCRAASRVEGQECTEDGQCLSHRCVPQEDRTLRCAPEC
ncbi:MAG: hypothetical protein AMXMBFR34_32170 [Myxococcaceae bacterium]